MLWRYREIQKNVVEGLGEELGRRKEDGRTVTFHISLRMRE
jgi:hypothetical protein